VREKKDSSLVVCANLVRDGQAQALFSAGSTGAVLAAATLIVGRLPGVARPALAVVLPGKCPVVLVDVGANADCKPEYLVQFAEMGRAYAAALFDVSQARIGLLGIGEEDSKGSTFAQEANKLMREKTPGFIGNVEGREMLSGVADVVVTDGFTGNVALKTIEGVFGAIFGRIKAMMATGAVSKVTALPLKGALAELKAAFDPEQYGAAPLLGVKGLCLVGHGSSNGEAICNGILAGARALRGNVTGNTADALAADAGARANA
jgi:glycerol-3-phosphate acyltransferase PlsX